MNSLICRVGLLVLCLGSGACLDLLHPCMGRPHPSPCILGRQGGPDTSLKIPSPFSTPRSVCLFCCSSWCSSPPTVNTEQDQRTFCHSWACFPSAFQPDPHRCCFASPSLCWLLRFCVSGYCWHFTDIQEYASHVRYFDFGCRDFFFLPVKLWLHEVWQSLFSKTPKLDVSVNCWAELLFLLSVCIVYVTFLKLFVSLILWGNIWIKT